MTYRHETEHLRAKVAELEEQVAALRGPRREASSDLFPRRVKRQQWIIVAVAVLATGASGLCAMPTIGVTLDTPSRTAAELASLPSSELPGEGVIDVDFER